MTKIRILHAPENAKLAERLAEALAIHDYGVALDTGAGAGDLDPRDVSAAIVIWSAQSVASPAIIKAARDALARRMLIPVAIGKISPPQSFEHVWPMDLAGWTGASDDPRWRFVLEELDLAVRRSQADAPSAPPIVNPSAELQETPAPAAVVRSTPSSSRNGGAPSKAQLSISPLVFGAGGLFGAIALGGAFLMGLFSVQPPLASGDLSSNRAVASRATTQDAPASAPVIAYVEPGDQAGATTQLPAETSDKIDGIEETVQPVLRTADHLDPLAANDADLSQSIVATLDQASAFETPALTTPVAVAKDDAPPADGNGSAGVVQPVLASIDAPSLADDIMSESEGDADPIEDALYTDLSYPAEGDVDIIAQLAKAADQEAAAENTLLGNYFRECLECPDMASLEPGSFILGAPDSELARTAAEGPPSAITIDKGFAIGTSEVTFEQWDACVENDGCNYRPRDAWGRGKQPVINVSWQDAQDYVRWLSERTGSVYRLPTEAEWEYAARAGAQSAFAFGDALSTEMANYHGEFPYRGPRGAFRGRTVKVASFSPNIFGLFDMHGNVWEWTSDCWRDTHQSNDEICYARVIKGGAWNTGGWRLRSAHRRPSNTDARELDKGFRVVREMP